MSFYVIINENFLIDRQLLVTITDILEFYKIIMINGGSVITINLHISKWSILDISTPNSSIRTEELLWKYR